MNTPTELSVALLTLIEPLVADAVDAELKRRENLNRNPGLMLTTTQVAEQLQVNPRTIQRMCWDNRLTHVTIGNQFRIKQSDVPGWSA